MSEQPTPRVAEDSALDGAQALTAEKIERILSDFRSWLERVAASALPAPAEAALEPVSLHTLVGQFIALRHEVNLQTRATRAQQEQTAQSLETLERALESIEQAHEPVEAEPATDSERAVEEQLRPLLKALLDVVDLMDLAGREVGRVQDALQTQTAKLAKQLAAALGDDPQRNPDAVRLPEFEPPPVAAPHSDSFLRRLLGRGTRRAQVSDAQMRTALEQQREHVAKWCQGQMQRLHQEFEAQRAEHARGVLEGLDGAGQLIESVLTGYRMSLQRLQRMLDQFGLEPIPCEGESFDPEMMEVVEAVSGTGLPAGEVIQEVRRGYFWRGKLFRYAQVKVARS